MQTPVRVLVLILLLGCLVGCVSTATPILVPTQPLRTPSPTPTALPLTPTSTPEELLSAIDINVTSTMSQASNLTPLISGDVSLSSDFLRQMQTELAERVGTTVDRILLGTISVATWADEDLGCTQNTSSSLSQERTGYIVNWLVGDRVYEFHTENETRAILCPGSKIARDDLLLAVDLVANDLLVLAQRRLARELDLPQERIRLETIFPVTWQDTSLGCPQPDVEYAPAELRGYLIEVAVGGETYIFHTDDSRLIPCTLERQQLPPGLDR